MAATAPTLPLVELVLEGKAATVEGRLVMLVLGDKEVTVALGVREVMVVLGGTTVLTEEDMGATAHKDTSTPTRSSIPKTQSHQERIIRPSMSYVYFIYTLERS